MHAIPKATKRDTVLTVVCAAILIVVISGLVVWPQIQASLPERYTGVLAYKSPIQSFGIGLGAQNNIYLTIGNQTIICQLLNMDSEQQSHILSLQQGQEVTVTTIGNGVCDTK